MKNNSIQIELDDTTIQIAKTIAEAQGITVESLISKLVRNHALAILETEEVASSHRSHT